MRALLPILLVLSSGCSCDSDATAANTVIVDARFTELAGDPTLGEPAGSTTTSRTAIIDPGEGAALDPDWEPVRIRVDLVHGPVPLLAAGEPEGRTLDVPQQLRVTVEDSGLFEVEPSCEEEIVHGEAFPGMPNARVGTWVSCQLNLKRRGSNTIASLTAFGDGTIEVRPPSDGSVTYQE